MNPVTRALLKKIDHPGLQAFAEAWDELEVLMVDVYKANGADAAQQAEFADIRRRLAASYPAWQAALEPHWRATTIKGQSLNADPFHALINLDSAEAIVNNWSGMQTLPAAREALNSMLVERIESSSE